VLVFRLPRYSRHNLDLTKSDHRELQYPVVVSLKQSRRADSFVLFIALDFPQKRLGDMACMSVHVFT
jgi:hypothetical protein